MRWVCGSGRSCRKARRDLEFLFDDILGILLYGSWARGEGHDGSDIDICIVAPLVEDKIALWRGILSRLRDDRYDVRIFELMPMFLKAAVIEQGVVVQARDVPELYEYFYPFRRIWDDQKHRQILSRDEALVMFGEGRKYPAASDCMAAEETSKREQTMPGTGRKYRSQDL